MKERIYMAAIGLLITLFVFLISSFTDKFVTKADYNSDKAVIKVMANDIKHIKEKVDKL